MTIIILPGNKVLMVGVPPAILFSVGKDTDRENDDNKFIKLALLYYFFRLGNKCAPDSCPVRAGVCSFFKRRKEISVAVIVCS